MVRKISITVIITLVVVVFLLGFVDRSYKEQVKSSADITYSIDSIPQNLKAISDLSKREQDIICATSRGLIEVDGSGKIVPSLAESVEIKDDGAEYDFTIRDDVYWTDGTKVTASDVVSFFREVITEEDENSISVFLSVFGAKDYKENDRSFNESVGIRAEDNRVIIRLNNAEPTFLQELSKPQYRVRKNVLLWEDLAQNYNDIPYSGSYAIKSIDDSQIVLQRSNSADAKIPQTMHIIKDDGEDLALAAFEVGQRDIVINPPKSQLERLDTEGKLFKNVSNKGSYLVFNPNNTSVPVEGKREIYKNVSKALESYQLSNKAYIELADGSYFRQDEEDLTKLQSRKVMSNTEGEWEKPDEIVLLAEENLKNKEICDYLKKWFADNTDIILTTVLVKAEDMNVIKDKTYYNMALIDVEATINNKKEFYQQIYEFIPKDIRDEYDVLNEADTDTELEQEIEDTLFNKYSVLPLMFYNETVAINKNIENISFDGNGNLKFDMVKK